MEMAALFNSGLTMGVTMNGTANGLFLLAAVALLGSPGPGIAALLAVTRGGGLGAGLRDYAGLQVGLAIAAVLHLAYLAWESGTAPVAAPGNAGISASPIGGFFLGIPKPRAYLAFASLMASTTLVSGGVSADAALKWALIVGVILVVDI